MNDDQLQSIGRQLLEALGEDPDRDGLRDTPRRFAAMWREFIEHDPGKIDTSFPVESLTGHTQMVVASNIGAWSVCEHHLLPFYVNVAVGYLPREQLLGLSKFARIVKHSARRLQVQESLVEDVAQEVESVTGSADVAVHARGIHLCSVMRGVEMPVTFTTSVMLGAFREQVATRDEFLRTIELGGEVKLIP